MERHVLPIADSCGPIKLDPIVHRGRCAFDPVEQAEAEDEAKAAWGVRVDDYATTGLGRDLADGDHRAPPPPSRAFNDLPWPAAPTTSSTRT